MRVEIWVNGQPVHDCTDKFAISYMGRVGIFATGVSVVSEFHDIASRAPSSTCR